MFLFRNQLRDGKSNTTCINDAIMTYLYSNQNKYLIDINFVHDINIEAVVMSIRYTSGRHGVCSGLLNTMSHFQLLYHGKEG